MHLDALGGRPWSFLVSPRCVHQRVARCRLQDKQILYGVRFLLNIQFR
jgi:hypothetical protein